MSKEVIAFFSSDARKLFQDDIYRVLVYPQKYVIHFRYSEGIISNSINVKKLPGKEGIIFFSKGNDRKLKEEDRNINNISVRKIKVKALYKSKSTKLLHVFLELNDFIQCNVVDTHKSELPPFMFISSVKVNDIHVVDWKYKTKELEVDFKNLLFFNFSFERKAILNRIFNISLKPKFSEKEYECYYKLNDESNYILNISFYNSNKDASQLNNFLKIENKEERFSTSYSDSIYIYTRYDDRNYKIVTHTITIRRVIDFVKFQSILFSIDNNNIDNTQNIIDEIHVDLRIDIIKSPLKVLFFGIFAILALTSIPIAKEIFEQIYNCSKSFDIKLLIIGIITTLTATCSLFYFFNKK